MQDTSSAWARYVEQLEEQAVRLRRRRKSAKQGVLVALAARAGRIAGALVRLARRDIGG